MGWRVADFSHLAKFNSDTSAKLLDQYEDFVDRQYRIERARISSRTFAPSSFRCPRKSWFRLRGVAKDTASRIDKVLEFAAEIGTARHAVIQQNLKTLLKDDWLSVTEFLQAHPIPYEYFTEESGLETKISIVSPPVTFACDGIIRFNNKIYLLEIKTCDRASWEKLTCPKAVHIDQIKCYSTLLGISDVIFIYEDRQYGEHKVFEIHIAEFEQDDVLQQMNDIMQAVEDHLAPDKVSGAWSDYICINCEYLKVCHEWG